MRNCRVTKNVFCRCSCRYTLYHTQNNNHLDQNIGIIWHKRSMLVNDNTAECVICFSRKKETITKLSTGRYGHKRNFLGQLYRYEKPACSLLKTSQESREWLISLRQSHRLLILHRCRLLKKCENNPSREEMKASVFSNRISRRKSQSLHSQKLPRWAQQISITKEKNPFS